MTIRPIFIAISLLFFSKIAAQQEVVSGLDSTWITQYDFGPASHYPTEISIAGGHSYLLGVQVEFPYVFLNKNFDQWDLLLESPAGTRVMLMSDYDHQSNGFTFDDGGFSSFSIEPLPLAPITYGTFYVPANFGADADTFPLPGPGIIVPGVSTFTDFVNEDPNGTWRLWIVDDFADDSYFSLGDGWKLTITTSPTPVCLQPELPTVSGITDSTALFAWQGVGAATKWDVFYASTNIFPIPEPDENTVPSFADLTNDSMVIAGLPPGEEFRAYVRSACPGGGHSFWVGPFIFSTLFTPCLHPNPLQICQTVDCDTVRWFTDYTAGTNCVGSNPHWVFRFIAPESGAYWIQAGAFNGGGFSEAYWMPDDPANTECPSDGWKCISQNAGTSAPGFLDTLTAGAAYFLMFSNDFEPPVFRLSRCPSPGVVAEQIIGPGFFEPFSATVQLSGSAGSFLSGNFDFYHTLDSTLIPSEGITPSETDAVLLPADNGMHHLQTNSLQPSSRYRLWARPHCENGAAQGCWEGPFIFDTGTFCGTFDSVWIDLVTENTARLNLVPPDALIINYRIMLNGQFIPNGIGSVPNSAAGQVSTVDFSGLLPDTTYEVFLKAYCLPSGQDNAWYGPFSFHTLPGCFVNVQDIQCGQQVTGVHYEYGLTNAFGNPTCVDDWDYTNLNEHLFRIKATQTGQAVIAQTDTGSPQVQWYYKDAEDGCNSAGLVSIGCVVNFNLLYFPVDSGKTYLLLADGAYWNQVHQPFDIDFTVENCGLVCAMVDSFWLDAETSTTATIRWRNVSPGATYEVQCTPQDDTPVRYISTTDTLITVDSLIPSELYRFKIATNCGGFVTPEFWSAQYQLGDHEVIRESVLSRCNPRFLPPGGIFPANYEVSELTVPVDGDYRLVSRWADTHLYDGGFDPENPSANLLAAVTDGGGRDTVVFLQTGHAYHWVANAGQDEPILSGFNYGSNNLKLLVDGPAPAQLGSAKWNGRELAPHGQVATVTAWHTGVCQDSSGWMHFYANATDPNDITGDALLLSLQGYSDANVLNSLPMVFVKNPSVSLVTNPPAPFVQNPSGWYEMNRFWLMQDLLPSQQIDSVFTIRFYYQESDFENLKTAIEAAGGSLASHEEMYFHKINGFHNYTSIDPDSGHPGIPAASGYDETGYWSYENGAAATTSTWLHGTYGGEHYAEMVIRGFSGGGGGGSVNGNGVFDTTHVSGVKKEEWPLGSDIKLFPNPTTGELTLEFKGTAPKVATLQILDLLGRTLHTEKLLPGSQAQQLSICELPAGVYFVKVLDGGEPIWVEKVVKQ